jgi:murein DD-endopeptidase MepM/ murein hydrolase activator NlpD
MELRISRQSIIMALILIIPMILFVGLLAWTLNREMEQPEWWLSGGQEQPTALASSQVAVSNWGLATARPPGAPRHTPTPDLPHPLPAIRQEEEQYLVKVGDTLGQIASRYGVTINQITQANELTNPNLLAIGQNLTIPAPIPLATGPDFKIIPDSELVYGPANILFNVEEFVAEHNGYLNSYYEQVNERSLSGAQVIKRVAQDYSVSVKLLLAVLQHQSGWLTNPSPDQASLDYPMGLPQPQRKGLYRQLSWAANNLNRGFYLWRVNAVATWILADGSIIPVAPTINAGSASIQQMYALLYDREEWERAVTDQGLFATYNSLFGYPFDYAIEPSLPADLAQPPLQLPFEPGKSWAFTSGPHGAWGDGSAWAALDFAPPGDQVGCVISDDWVVAAADGLIIRANNGAVIQDLDGDGYEQTGWVLLYMHIEGHERVAPGVFVKAGERIGHPSCEGGISTGTHVHLARRYNGEWIPADQDLPFVLDGWVSIGAGVQYDGFLQRGDKMLEAYAGRNDSNVIQR